MISALSSYSRIRSTSSCVRRSFVAQEKLAKLVPNAKHITNTNSGHEVHKEQPQLVIDSIREVVDAVRDPASWP
jgi:hypothetical protein